jgi:hypothetical protein
MISHTLATSVKNTLYHNRTLAVTEAYGVILAFVFN